MAGDGLSSPLGVRKVFVDVGGGSTVLDRGGRSGNDSPGHRGAAQVAAAPVAS